MTDKQPRKGRQTVAENLVLIQALQQKLSAQEVLINTLVSKVNKLEFAHEQVLSDNVKLIELNKAFKDQLDVNSRSTNAEPSKKRQKNKPKRNNNIVVHG